MNNKKHFFDKQFFYLGLVIVAVLLMGIGYAAINSIVFDIGGQVSAKVQEGIFINDVNYVRSLDADVSNSKIKNTYQNNLTTNIVLSTTNPSSYITYEVSIHNSTDKEYSFVETNYIIGNDTYDNENITFNLTGLSPGNKIECGQTLTFQITFSYKDSVIPESNQLNSILNFKFKEEPPVGTLKNVGSDANSVFGYQMGRSNIEAIYTENHIDIPTGTISWDASAEGNNSIQAWILDNDGNGLYTLYLGSARDVISLPSNSSAIFDGYVNVKNMDLKYLDTSQVTSMRGMFYNCTNLPSLDLSNFDTSQVTSMDSMFSLCRNLKSLNVDNFNVTNLTSMYDIFAYCNQLSSLNVSNWNTSQVTTMQGVFYDCYSLTSLNISNWNTAKVTTMLGMFYNCARLTSLNVSNFDTSKVTDMYAMFYNCVGLTSLNVSNFDTSKVTDMNNMFNNCSNLTTLNLSNFNTAKVTTMQNMFYNCGNLTSLNVSNFDTSQVTTMHEMFSTCSNLTSIDVSNFNTSQVTTIQDMFAYCNKLTALDAGNWDTSNVTIMQGVFYNCSNLTSLNLSNWDLSKVINMPYMFYNCSKLNSLDFRNAEFNNVNNYESLFLNTNANMYIIAKDNAAREWIQQKYGAGKGTIVTVAEL